MVVQLKEQGFDFVSVIFGIIPLAFTCFFNHPIVENADPVSVPQFAAIAFGKNSRQLSLSVTHSWMGGEHSLSASGRLLLGKFSKNIGKTVRVISDTMQVAQGTFVGGFLLFPAIAIDQ